MFNNKYRKLEIRIEDLEDNAELHKSLINDLYDKISVLVDYLKLSIWRRSPSDSKYRIKKIKNLKQ